MSKPHIPFRIRRSIDGQWYSVIIAKNGQVLFTSETYKRKRNCIKGIAATASLCVPVIYDHKDGWEEKYIIDETIKLIQIT